MSYVNNTVTTGIYGPIQCSDSVSLDIERTYHQQKIFLQHPQGLLFVDILGD